MKNRLLWMVALATATSACLGVRAPPRFGALRADNKPFQLHQDIRLYAAHNGMTVVLVPDRRTNLVTVDARYRFGASDDPPGRAGMAHLVEHLTFEAWTGPDRASLSDRLSEAALEHNAFTNHDVTHYTATALADRLTDVLEIEAQRLEMTCDQLDDAVFSRERDVVLEEEAQRRAPRTDFSLQILQGVWGQHHPYAREIGTLEVANATKDEACGFLSSHYAPDSLILVVTGDFDPAALAQQIGKRFGQNTRRRATAHTAVPQAHLTGTRARYQADVDKAAALVFFPAPPWGSKDTVLHLLAVQRLRQVMAGANEELDWITGVQVGTEGAGEARLLRVEISVDDPKRLDAAVDELFARAPKMFSDMNPYSTVRLITQLQNNYLESYESFETRSSWFADYLTYTRHYELMEAELESLEHVTMADADRYVRARFVRNQSHVALVDPSGKPATASTTTVASGQEPDLAPWRAPVDPQEAQHPLPVPASRISDTIDEMALKNGLRVLLVPDPSSSLVDVRLVLPHGSASDPHDRQGLAVAAAALLEDNPRRRYRARDAFLLTWGLSVGTQLDEEVHETSTVFTARGAANRADWHVWRLLWLVEQCGYLDESVTAFRDMIIHASAKEEGDPVKARMHQLLFGKAHPYAAPLPTGNAWSWLTTDELERYHEKYYAPRGATLIVTGDFELEAMRKHVRSLFGPWSDVATVPPETVPAPQPEPGPSWLGMRDPSRSQVGLEVAFAIPSAPGQEHAARIVLSEMVRDRLRIVREGMGASYGVTAEYTRGAGGGAFYITSDLDPGRASKAATALLSELEALRTGAGNMLEDFVRARRRALANALADAAGVTAVADELELGVRQGLPVDYIDQLAAAISKVTPAEVAAVAATDLDPHRRVVSVTATPERVDGVLTALGASEPTIFDKKERTAAAQP
ncbi:M16 family metallopeptidase [Hyalangium versicolor]|uniref:M16 family metallopeptidase n=1 Tax=Hyalangium versicolor TaxID=2861190 RepID=UPI001CCB02A2|nr:M16 family metallopeptidase [Hyalangium versicolor]